MRRSGTSRATIKRSRRFTRAPCSIAALVIKPSLRARFSSPGPRGPRRALREPPASRYSRRSASLRIGARAAPISSTQPSASPGFAKSAVPTSTAVAPTSRNSTASAGRVIPPIPTTGMSTACTTSHVLASASGLIAGPERPPSTVPRIGFRVRESTAMPMNVLTRDTASAPHSSQASAISAMRVTFGVSLAMRGSRVKGRIALITSRAIPASVEYLRPCGPTLGQEMLTSIACATPLPSTPRTSWQNSSTSSPSTETTTAHGSSRRIGTLTSRNPWSPGFSIPIEFRSPEAVSQTRGGGFPARGRSVTVFVTMPPIFSSDTSRSYSRPYPMIPDATSTGLRSSMEPMRTRSECFTGSRSQSTRVASITGPSTHIAG